MWNCTSNMTDTDEIPRTVHAIVGTILLVTTIVSIIANGIVIYVHLVRRKFLRNRINAYLFIICLLAFITAVIGCPMVISSSFAGHWLYGDDVCTFYGFLMTMCGLMTILVLAVISVDRFVFIVLDIFTDPSTNIFSITATSACFIFAFIMSCPPLFGWNRYTLEASGTSCGPDIQDEHVMSRMYLTTLILTCFVLPLSVMVFCYCRLIAKVKGCRRKLLRSSQLGDNLQQKIRQRKLNSEHQLIISIVYIVGAFLISWTPYAISMLLSIFCPATMTPISSSIPSMITKTGICFTPLVYLGKDERMQKAVMEVFPCLRPDSTCNDHEEIGYIASDNKTVHLQSNVNTIYSIPKIIVTVHTDVATYECCD